MEVKNENKINENKINENVNIKITKNDFLNFSQKKQPKETIIEMSNLNDTNSNNSNNSHNSNKQNTPISLEHIETNLDNIDLNESKVESELINEELTYDIPKFKMIEYLTDKNKHIQDKQTIYEYYYESLNLIYSKISIFLIIISSIVTLLGSAQLGDVYMSDAVKYVLKILVIVFSFIITVLSSVLKFQLYKEKIESIGKYMEQLDILIDDISILIKKIELMKISDQEFFQQLQEISIIVTRTNSKLFNIRSDKYYQYYKKLNLISSKKWSIQHEIKTQNETKYNEFLKTRLQTMEERLELKTKFKEIDERIKQENINNFYNSDLFSYSKSTENHEE